MDLESYLLNEYHKPAICARCGGIMRFRGVGEYECEKCGFIMYDDYGKVRNFLEQNGNATVAETAAATGVSQQSINQMLREERFEISTSSKSFLKCEGCGKPIRLGKYCSECAKLVAAAEARRKRDEGADARKENISGFAKVQSEDDAEMRFLNRGNNRIPK